MQGVGKKIGRNDPCWCGSGKKYKKCHLNRHIETPVAPWEAEQQYRKSFGSKYCSCPESLKNQCAKRIIKAHTVSKSSSLLKISRDGHVYGLVPSFANLTKNQGLLVPELVGVNKASTFTGFCGVHDKSLFSEFEDKPFVGSAKQAFLIGYRALSREYFTKMAQSDLQDTYKDLDKGRSQSAQWSIQEFSFLHSIGVQLGLRDIQAHKSNYDGVLVSGQFENVRAYTFEFEDILPLACSGAFYPERDFNGERLQDLSEMGPVLDNLCFSIFASENRSYAVFTWLDDSGLSCNKFIDSLMNMTDHQIFPVLVQFTCATFENVFFAPKWWESLSGSAQAQITTLLASGANPFVLSEDDVLVDKGLDLGQYNVARQYGINTSNNAIN
ncbi:MAG: SEC-C domain-containing protein [Opitutaceae bacterium]|nr:SEC-C domain-containing protein [Opitutaceae bacterium]